MERETMKRQTRQTRLIAAAAALAGAALVSTACASPSTTPGAAEAGAPTPEAPATGRVAVAYENGIAVLDPETLDVVDEVSTEAFTRLNPFGDGRHVAVTTSQGFQLLDVQKPELTDLLVPAATAFSVSCFSFSRCSAAAFSSSACAFLPDAEAMTDDTRMLAHNAVITAHSLYIGRNAAITSHVTAKPYMKPTDLRLLFLLDKSVSSVYLLQ